MWINSSNLDMQAMKILVFLNQKVLKCNWHESIFCNIIELSFTIYKTNHGKLNVNQIIILCL
jgi:hypothetical protein